MNSHVKLAGHPVHPMLIVFPLGLLAGSVVFDIAYLATRNARWGDISYWMIVLGLLTGILAGAVGAMDYRAIPDGTRAKRIGMLHGAGNVIVLLLFAGSWYLRRNTPSIPPTGAIVLSFIGVGLALVTGWLGGELVDRLGVGVDDGAHLNSPSSLSGEPASKEAPRPRKAA